MINKPFANPFANPFTHTVNVIPPDVDPATALAAIHADCPECQAALARGEQPLMMTGAELLAMLPRHQRRRIQRELARAEARAARAAMRGGGADGAGDGA